MHTLSPRPSRRPAAFTHRARLHRLAALLCAALTAGAALGPAASLAAPQPAASGASGPAAGGGVEVSGTHFDATTVLDGQPLVLNGAGLRTFVILEVYAAGLYVPQKGHSTEALISQPGPKSIHLVLHRDLTADEFTNALVKGFTENQPPEALPRLQARLDELKALMQTFGAAKKGWRIEIDYLPASGTRFTLNGRLQGKPIAGEDFFQGMMKIWLGPHPVDSALKRALLGRKG